MSLDGDALAADVGWIIRCERNMRLNEGGRKEGGCKDDDRSEVKSVK